MENEKSGWPLAGVLILFAAALGLTVSQYMPGPRLAPLPTAGAPGEFSVARARAVLQRLVGDGAPHPAGSDAAMRERVLEEFRKIEYAPSVQQAFACSEYNTCAPVNNVVARLPGRDPGPATLLAAHYDSVGAGPGATDDGMGAAAVLEAARALKADQPQHDVIFLITDGEEAGLLGAQAFVEEHPWAAEVRAAVNLDARGPGGPVIMLPSSPNAWLLGIYASVVKHPATSSMYHTVFPNWRFGTDFNAFQKKGIPGFNLFVVGNFNHYHTPSDDFEHSSPEDLQTIGETALALVRSLARSGLERATQGNAVFLDVFGVKTFWWPEKPNRILALAVLLLLILEGALLVRRARLQARALLRLVAGFAAMVGGGFLLVRAMRWVPGVAGDFPFPWAAKQASGLVMLWAAGFALTGLIASVIVRRGSFWQTWLGLWTGWAAAALVTSLRAPDGSYLFLLPAAAACFAGAPGALRATDAPWSRSLAALLPAAAAACLWFPVIWFRYNCAGLQFTSSITILSVVLFTATMPVFALTGARWRWSATLGAGAVAVVAGIVLWAAPAFSSGAPQRTNILLHEDMDTGVTRWILSGDTQLPEHFRAAFPFHFQETSDLPGLPPPLQIAEAPRQALDAPELVLVEESRDAGHRRVRLRLSSPRGAPNAALFLPGALPVESLSIEGKALPWSPELTIQKALWRRIVFLRGLPPEGAEIEVTVGSGAPIEALIEEISPGLPPAGTSLSQARSAFATPFLDGDAMVITRIVRLAPAAADAHK